jgi:hypothetical protein
MSCSRLEPIPADYLVPGDLVLSPGCGHIFLIKSYPICRLYYAFGEKFEFQPNVYEYRKGTQGNFLSYIAVILGGNLETALTVTDYFKKLN